MKQKGIRRYKIAQQDYEMSMLPQTHRAVFFDVLKLQWRKLLILGLILAAFSLPMILLNLARDGYAYGLILLSGDATEDVKNQAGMQILSADVIFSALQTIPFMIYSVGLAGVMRVLRQFAWGENVHIPTDFGKGVKDNFRPMLLLAFLSGAIIALCYFLYYLAICYQTDMMWILCIMPMAFSAMFVLPILVISIVMIPVYSSPIIHIFRMALWVYVKGTWKVLLAVLLTVALRTLGMLPSTFFHFVFGLLASLAAPTVLLGWTLFCYHRFDKDLNPDFCPELVGRGLYIPPEEGSEEL